MRVLVCGGRAYGDRAKLFEVLDAILIEHDIELLIHGGASGADALAAEWAEHRDVQQVVCAGTWPPSDMTTATTARRMIEILLHGRQHTLVAFPGGWETLSLVKRARAAGIDIIEVGDLAFQDTGATFVVSTEEQRAAG